MSNAHLRPRVVGDWWLVGPSPDLDSILEGPLVRKQRYSLKDQPEKDAPVDHHAFCGQDGIWHMWGCVRNSSVGRVLYHWEADEITQSPWRMTGEVIRADHAAGESLVPGDDIRGRVVDNALLLLSRLSADGEDGGRTSMPPYPTLPLDLEEAPARHS